MDLTTAELNSVRPADWDGRPTLDTNTDANEELKRLKAKLRLTR